MSLSHVWLVMRKEWKESLNSPMPYVFWFVFSLLTSVFFFFLIFTNERAGLEPFFEDMPVLLLFFLPGLAMRSFAEEYKTGTMEVLATLPVRDTEIVLGKYLAGLGLWAFMLALSGFYALVLLALGNPDVGQLAAGFLGAFLLGGLYMAVGTFASSLTRSQVVAFILGFVLCFAIYLFGVVTESMAGFLARGMTFLGLRGHFDSFIRGVVDSRDVVYFLSGQLIFLAATLASFNSRRWR